MTELFFMLLGAALFALGFWAARARADLETPPPRVPDGEEAARLRQIEADRRAFSALMGYNADVAYGEARLGEEGR